MSESTPNHQLKTSNFPNFDGCYPQFSNSNWMVQFCKVGIVLSQLSWNCLTTEPLLFEFNHSFWIGKTSLISKLPNIIMTSERFRWFGLISALWNPSLTLRAYDLEQTIWSWSSLCNLFFQKADIHIFDASVNRLKGATNQSLGPNFSKVK